ncbi:hypothetical protein Q8A67_022202 [Cirrhinus molitorella]|uniref:non-specific serine/threonine protein kinase n=1 Tax=Cirrhinus molitorella TaxID=172907 RepID=A0AA88P3K3_9TELE|nr:hypothetical protein Q8A67_022202 [Cirrhinus molitorella]
MLLTLLGVIALIQRVRRKVNINSGQEENGDQSDVPPVKSCDVCAMTSCSNDFPQTTVCAMTSCSNDFPQTTVCGGTSCSNDLPQTTVCGGTSCSNDLPQTTVCAMTSCSNDFPQTTVCAMTSCSNDFPQTTVCGGTSCSNDFPQTTVCGGTSCSNDFPQTTVCAMTSCSNDFPQTTVCAMTSCSNDFPQTTVCGGTSCSNDFSQNYVSATSNLSDDAPPVLFHVTSDCRDVAHQASVYFAADLSLDVPQSSVHETLDCSVTVPQATACAVPDYSVDGPQSPVHETLDCSVDVPQDAACAGADCSVDAPHATVGQTEDTAAPQSSQLQDDETSIEINSRRYEICGHLGEGGFGTVYAATRLNDGLQVAVKFASIWDTEIINIDGCSEPLPLEVALQILANKGPRVEEIIQLLDWQVEPDYYFMVLERPMPCQSLFDYLKCYKGTIEEDVVRVIMHQVIYAAQTCCQRGVLHRDIKLENLLINPDTLKVKLIDFGCGAILTDEGYTSFAGTSEYCPPEYQKTAKYHGGPATVWSLGILLFVMLFWKFPKSRDLHKVNDQNWTKTGLSKECCDFLRCCLQIDPKHRLELEKLSLHDWFMITDKKNDHSSVMDLSSLKNGKSCYTCDWEDCSKTLSCWGNEDYCFTTYETSSSDHSNPPLTYKGCVSKSACDRPGLLVGSNGNATCCLGNLCNGAQSVTQSFLFLCCSLLPFILLH